MFIHCFFLVFHPIPDFCYAFHSFGLTFRCLFEWLLKINFAGMVVNS